VRPIYAIVSVPLLFGIGSLVARALVAHPPAQLARVFALPLLVVNWFNGFGVAPALLLLATIAVLGIILGVAFGPPRTFSIPYPRARTLIGAASALSLLAAFSWPFTFSSDTIAYAAYGLEALRGLDPFTSSAQASHNAFTDAMRLINRRDVPLCVYGPVFVWFSEVVVTLTQGFPPALTIAVLRVAAIVTFLVSVLVFSKLTEPLAPARRIAVLALYALNPLAIWAVAEGHNDIFALIAAMVGVLLATRGRPLLGGLLIGLTPLVKLPFVIAVVPLSVYLWGRGRRREAVRVAAGGALGLAVWVVWFVPRLHNEAGNAVGSHNPSLSLVLTLVPVALAVAAIAFYAFRELLFGNVRAFVWLGAAAFLATFSSWPWYALWVLPLIAVPAGAIGMGLWASTLLVTYRYYFDATFPTKIHLSQVNSVAKMLPIAAAVGYGAWQAARHRNRLP